MPFEAILYEVEPLHNVSTRLEGLAERHPLVSEVLITIGDPHLANKVARVLIFTSHGSSDPRFQRLEDYPADRLSAVVDQEVFQHCLYRLRATATLSAIKFVDVFGV